jgi:hypothetical protein
MHQMFDDQLLEEFVHGFYGHGNLESKYWFIGMEHGGGDSFENVQRRVQMWAELGKGPANDLAVYCRGIGESYYFRQPVKNQATWNKLIRLLLSAKGDDYGTLAKVKAYQAEHLGRSNGETCLLELLPVASRSTNHWLCGDHSRLPYLKSREAYRSHLMPLRARRLKQMIAGYKPRLVHFYGTTYKEWWHKIAGVPFERRKADSRAFYYSRRGDTLFLITEHSTAHGVTIEYFHDIGRFVHKLA